MRLRSLFPALAVLPLLLLGPLESVAADANAGQNDLVWDDAQQKELDQALEEFRVSSQPGQTPVGSVGGELVERNHLLADLITQLERRKDVLRRLGESSQKVAEQQYKTRKWSTFDTAPPYSILLIDHLRQSLDDALSQVDAANTRAKLLNQEIQDNQKRLDAAEVELRQAVEKIGRATAQDEKNRLDWLRQLAQLRAHDAAAAMGAGQARRQLSIAEGAEEQASIEFFRKQLSVAEKHAAFPRHDLDNVLSELDKQQSRLNEKQKNAETEIGSTRNALAEARRQLLEAQSATQPVSADRLELLSQTVELRQLQADNADSRHETLQHIGEALEWKRTGWQLRWDMANSEASDQVDEAMKQLDGLISRVKTWNLYVQNEYLRSRRLSENEMPAPPASMPKERQDLIKAFHEAYADNSRILGDTEQAVGDLLRLLTLWREDFQTKRQSMSASDTMRQGWDAARRAFGRFWDFELLAAEDSLVVDGRKVVAVRSVTVGKSLGLLMLVIVGTIVSRRLIRGVRHVAVRRFDIQPSYAKTVARWMELLATSLLVFIALYVTNIPLTVFAFLGGALAIGAGFGTQVLLKNMISGVILLLERPLRVGDIIEVGDVVGTVTHINIRSSTVRTSDGIEVLVPNATLLENNVTNWTYSTAKVRRTVSVGVDYAADLNKVAELLGEIAVSHPNISKAPEPQVLLSEFGSDAVIFSVRYWIDYAEQADASAIASDLRFMIAKTLREANVKIPGPQREVRIVKS
ncbi:MAG TPA: mechanosensitive ion channel domain-containing protein [Candidatus Sulfotelmatobacter sp.]|jgi:small-conductance mechanosensitive channel|nr:mechanosensitive ion channel domain-containing protein [Candidatus Sulfotelmatobacter sp.]